MNDIVIRDNRHIFIIVGISGSGKSTWANEYFNPHEVLSADKNRKLLAGHILYTRKLDIAAHSLVETMLRLQCEAGILVCVDNTNLDEKSRRELVRIAREYHYRVHYVLMTASDHLEACQTRNAARERKLHPDVLIAQYRKWRALDRKRLATECDELHEGYPSMVREFTKWASSEVLALGDVHGEAEKVVTFLKDRGYKHLDSDTPRERFIPPHGQKLLQLGDIVSRGPDSPRMLRILRNMSLAGDALVVQGNHDNTLLRILKGERAKGFMSMDQQAADDVRNIYSPEELQATIAWLDALPIIAELTTRIGKYLVSHAGPVYVEGEKPGTCLVPDNYRRKLTQYGYPNGATLPNGKRALYRVYDVADNGKYPGIIPYGHHNPSREQTLVVPYVNGNTVALESQIEKGGEVGWMIL